MAEPRLTTTLQVQAMLRTASGRGVFGTVVRRGDPTAGTVLLQLRTRAGNIVLTRLASGSDVPHWIRATGPEPVDDQAADAYVARALGRDPDLWLVELETADGTLPFPGQIEESPSGSRSP